jgi:hypothetical protein
MSLEKLEHLRALADYLGKEVYALDYDEPSGYFRLLPGPGAGLEPLAVFRIFTTDEDLAQADAPVATNASGPIRWSYRGTEFHIYRQP